MVAITVNRPARRSELTATAVSKTATPAEMKVAKKKALRLSKFFKKAVDRALVNGYKEESFKKVFGPPTVLGKKKVIGRQSLHGRLFYMSTAIDTGTGAIYQSLNVGPKFYGPLLPPANARIIGNSSKAQGEKLLDIVATGRISGR